MVEFCNATAVSFPRCRRLRALRVILKNQTAFQLYCIQRDIIGKAYLLYIKWYTSCLSPVPNTEKTRHSWIQGNVWTPCVLCFLVYLMMFSQLQRLYSIEWNNDCQGWTRKDVIRSGHGLHYDTIAAFSWSDWGNHKKKNHHDNRFLSWKLNLRPPEYK